MGCVEGGCATIAADIGTTHHVDAFVNGVQIISSVEALDGNLETIRDVKVEFLNHAPHFVELVNEFIEFERQCCPRLMQTMQTMLKPLIRLALAFYGVKSGGIRRVKERQKMGMSFYKLHKNSACKG